MKACPIYVPKRCLRGGQKDNGHSRAGHGAEGGEPVESATGIERELGSECNLSLPVHPGGRGSAMVIERLNGRAANGIVVLLIGVDAVLVFPAGGNSVFAKLPADGQVGANPVASPLVVTQGLLAGACLTHKCHGAGRHRNARANRCWFGPGSRDDSRHRNTRLYL